MNRVTNIAWRTASGSRLGGFAYRYDALGRQVEARDAAGVTTFAYDAFGANTNETVVGVAGTNVLERFTDAYGRDVGYALNGVRQSTLGYDLSTGRIVSMLAAGNTNKFQWTYLAGSNLKSSLLYPNGLTSFWTYDNCDNLLQVSNASPTNVISQFIYTYDANGQRVACARSGDAFTRADILAYAYNTRGELTNALSNVDAAYAYVYCYDDAGNRRWANENGTNILYEINQLNQFSHIAEFAPLFDDDGNQTMIKTGTGVWRVDYNGENRSVKWSNAVTNIVMSYDRQGRRVKKGLNSYGYNGYLQVVGNNGWSYVWDPTDRVATRPLVGICADILRFYTHDANKNVSDATAKNGEVTSHYNYAPFGDVISDNLQVYGESVWRFSSEYADKDLDLVYFNFRNYQPSLGKWGQRDFLGEIKGANIYLFVRNNPVLENDLLGLLNLSESDCKNTVNGAWKKSHDIAVLVDKMKSHKPPCKVPTVYCACCGDAELGGGFYDRDNTIEICYNNKSSEADLLQTYLHELIHAWNECNGFGGESCDEAVCDDILAYYYSGGCQEGGDPAYGDKSTWDCVIRRAADSAQDFCKNPGETDEQANYNARKRGWAVLRRCLKDAPRPH